MDPMTIALAASAVMGALKSKEDSRRHKGQMKVEATRERWSPWTGRGGESLAPPSSMGTLMQSLATGAMMGQQFGKGSDYAEQIVPEEDPRLAQLYSPYGGRMA